MRYLVQYISKSTMKREFAFFLMAWYLSVGTFIVYHLPVEQAKSLWENVQLMMFSFAAMAFGMDWISKQTNIAGPPIVVDPTKVPAEEPTIPPVATPPVVPPNNQ